MLALIELLTLVVDLFSRRQRERNEIGWTGEPRPDWMASPKPEPDDRPRWMT